MKLDTETLKNITNMSNKDELKEKSTANEKKKVVKKKEPKQKVKKSLGLDHRIKRDEILKPEISDEDDLMVCMIKEQVNAKAITMEDIYKVVSGNSGYNLFYGLGTRHTMNWRTFETWCNILKIEPTLSVKDKY